MNTLRYYFFQYVDNSKLKRLIFTEYLTGDSDCLACLFRAGLDNWQTWVLWPDHAGLDNWQNSWIHWILSCWLEELTKFMHSLIFVIDTNAIDLVMLVWTLTKFMDSLIFVREQDFLASRVDVFSKIKFYCIVVYRTFLHDAEKLAP